MDFNSLFISKKRNFSINATYEKVLFLNLFSDWLSEAKKKISVIDGIISNDAIAKSFNSLYDIIIEISERTLFVEYKVFLEEMGFTEKSDAGNLHKFKKKLLSINYRKYLLEEYPVLFELVFSNIEYFIENINDIISNYIHDWNEIKKIFNIENSEIEYIRIGLGDRHNKNKSTTLLKLKSEQFIIFKPRDLAIEVSLSNFLKYYNSSCKTNIYLPKVLYRKKYSWAEFIEHSVDGDLYENFYSEIGQILCILYFLNGTDFHYENIIINNKKGLVLIDCESILYPIIKSNTSEHNVLSIGLLSKKIRIGNQQVDFGGLNIYNDISQEFPILKEGINIQNGEIKSFNEKSKLVKVNNFQLNKFENVNDYIDDILMGFRKSYTFLMKNKKKIFQYFNSTPYDSPIRFLLRNTFVYSHVLHESLSPILLTNKNERISFIEQLDYSHGKNINLLYSEVSDIYDNDIPYYYCNLKSTSLRNNNKLDEQNFFEKSPLDSLLYKLNNIISKTDLERQMLLIKYSFAQKTTRKSNKIFSKKYISENP